MARDEFRIALAAIAAYGSADEVAPERLLALPDRRAIVMAGGLAVSDDATGLRILPGCCAGLEVWRDWCELLDGKVPWLWHSPAPGFEFAAGVVRVRQDEELLDAPACDIPLRDLPGLLDGVRQDLLGFLGLVRKWSPDGLGDRLAAAFDEHFHISAPL